MLQVLVNSWLSVSSNDDVHEDLKHTRDSNVSKTAVAVFVSASTFELHQSHYHSQVPPTLMLVYDVHVSDDLELVLVKNRHSTLMTKQTGTA